MKIKLLLIAASILTANVSFASLADRKQDNTGPGISSWQINHDVRTLNSNGKELTRQPSKPNSNAQSTHGFHRKIKLFGSN